MGWEFTINHNIHTMEATPSPCGAATWIPRQSLGTATTRVVGQDGIYSTTEELGNNGNTITQWRAVQQATDELCNEPQTSCAMSHRRATDELCNEPQTNRRAVQWATDEQTSCAMSHRRTDELYNGHRRATDELCKEPNGPQTSCANVNHGQAERQIQKSYSEWGHHFVVIASMIQIHTMLRQRRGFTLLGQWQR